MKRSEIGKVYAIHTSKGYGVVQVCADKEELMQGINVTQIRVFGKLYPTIPENIEEILKGKEDFRVFCVVRTMVLPKYNMATYLGRYDLPADFQPTKYFKYTLYTRISVTPGLTRDWIIDEAGLKEYKDGIELKDWIENYLHLDSKKDDWKKIFSDLDYAYIYNGLGLIEDLENGYNPRNFLPADFDIPSKYLMKDMKG